LEELAWNGNFQETAALKNRIRQKHGMKYKSIYDKQASFLADVFRT